MKKLVLLTILCAVCVSAQLWYNNPSNCPSTYLSQTCAGSAPNVCGVNTGNVVFCYNTSSLTPPGGSASGSVTSYSGTAGGYLINCAGYTGSSPFCTNSSSFWCNLDNSCFDTLKRQTTCTGGKWSGESGAFSCGDCRSTYHDCDSGGDVCEIHDGDACDTNAHYNGCNGSIGNCVCNSGAHNCDGVGNSCEIVDGAACTKNGIPGTYSGCDGSIGNCVATPQHFITSILASYYTSNPLLWGFQAGNGSLLNLTSSFTGSNISFVINNSGCIIFPDNSAQCTASNGTNGSVSGLGVFVGNTSGTYNGSLSAGGFTGYKAANYLCNQSFAGSYLCFTDEILNTIRTQDITAISDWIDTAWVAEGPPGFTADANDCLGFSGDSNTVLGAFWLFDQTTGGQGWLAPCDVTKKLACCK